MRFIRKILIICLFLPLIGCVGINHSDHNYNPQNTSEYWGDESQIEVGKPNVIVDSLGNIIGTPSKILLLNAKMESHSISPETVEVIERYIDDNPEEMKETKIRVNQFAPVGEFKRLVKNKKVKWWWRVFPGVPTTMISSFGRVLGGDHYNPYTDTINIYSDVSAVALHESGHAVDFSEHAEKGTAGVYAVGRFLIPVTLHQEHVASQEAINYLKDQKDRDGENKAYKALYPAYGTYVGGATGLPFANAAGAAVGHVAGFVPRHNRKKAFEAYDEAIWSDEVVTNLSDDPINKSLLLEREEKEALLNAAFLNEVSN
ncbi:hypothetical protein ACFL49_00060 [Candidatus Omnitrophota bacterium]